jgi:hypothetical protein
MTQSEIPSPSFPIRKMGKGFGILLVVLSLGTTGYMLIEKWSLLDSLYMTVITITTVGYREMGPMSPAGMVFTIFVVFSGMGLIIYILGAVAQAMVEFQLGSVIGRRKLLAKIRSMKNHYIICGFGRIGKIICRELKANQIPMVVIDNGPGVEPAMEHEEMPLIRGDATTEDRHPSGCRDRESQRTGLRRSFRRGQRLHHHECERIESESFHPVPGRGRAHGEKAGEGRGQSRCNALSHRRTENGPCHYQTGGFGLS